MSMEHWVKIVEHVTSFKGWSFRAFIQILSLVLLAVVLTEGRETAGITSSGSEIKRHGIDLTNVAAGFGLNAVLRKILGG